MNDWVVFLLILGLPAGALVWLAHAWSLEHSRGRIPILLYHRLIRRSSVEASRSDERIWVSYDTSFAEQMRFLDDAGYTTLDFDDYLGIRLGQRPLPDRPVLVTFDDGYASVHELAFPILRKHAQKATVFVALQPDSHTRDQVEGMDVFLSPEQIRELSENSVSIESHTLTHPILTELPRERVRYELRESKRLLEAIIGRPVRHLAIPRAGYDSTVRDEAEAAGYLTVCCNNKGTSTALSDLFALPRIVIERDMSIEEFASALTPRGGFRIRIIGNVKRLPEWLGGPRFARDLRDRLYRSSLKEAFTPRSIGWCLAAAGVGYCGVVVAWLALG